MSLERERMEQANLEKHLMEKSREVIELQSRMDAQSAEGNVRWIFRLPYSDVIQICLMTLNFLISSIIN